MIRRGQKLVLNHEVHEDHEGVSPRKARKDTKENYSPRRDEGARRFILTGLTGLTKRLFYHGGHGGHGVPIDYFGGGKIVFGF